MGGEGSGVDYLGAVGVDEAEVLAGGGRGGFAFASGNFETGGWVAGILDGDVGRIAYGQMDCMYIHGEYPAFGNLL